MNKFKEWLEIHWPVLLGALLGVCFIAMIMDRQVEYEEPVQQEIKVLRMLSVSNGILVDPNLYLGAREDVRGEYILIIEDLEYISGIRIKATGEMLEFDERVWTEILSRMYFISE